jgi:hypothetical protein
MTFFEFAVAIMKTSKISRIDRSPLEMVDQIIQLAAGLEHLQVTIMPDGRDVRR